MAPAACASTKAATWSGRMRWRPLAAVTVRQLEDIIVRARHMKAAIEAGLACGCIRVEDCAPRR